MPLCTRRRSTGTIFQTKTKAAHHLKSAAEVCYALPPKGSPTGRTLLPGVLATRTLPAGVLPPEAALPAEELVPSPRNALARSRTFAEPCRGGLGGRQVLLPTSDFVRMELLSFGVSPRGSSAAASDSWAADPKGDPAAAAKALGPAPSS